MYNIVTRTLVGTHKNVITWTTYPSKEALDAKREAMKNQGWYEIIAEGVSNEDAIKLCSTPDTNAMWLQPKRIFSQQ